MNFGPKIILFVVAVMAAFGVIGFSHVDDAYAQDYSAYKKMSFYENGDHLVVSTSITQLFDKTSYDKLGNGLVTVVVARLVVFDKNDKPVSARVVRFRVAYDLWDDVYVVQVQDARKTNYRINSRAETLNKITLFEQLPIADLDAITPGENYRLVIDAVLNPVSKQSVAEMRRWLSKPAKSAAATGESSFFGAIVSVFANPKVATADRRLRLYSQPFYRPKKRPKSKGKSENSDKSATDTSTRGTTKSQN